MEELDGDGMREDYMTIDYKTIYSSSHQLNFPKFLSSMYCTVGRSKEKVLL